MSYHSNKGAMKRLTAVMLTGTMLVSGLSPMSSYADYMSSDAYRRQLYQYQDELIPEEDETIWEEYLATPSTATPSAATPSKAVPADVIDRYNQDDSEIPGMEIYDQDNADPLMVTRNQGVIQLSQSSTAKGYNSIAGSQDYASLLLYEDALEGDFTLQATVEITELKEKKTGFGLYIGAFSGVNAADGFASIGFRGDSKVRGYGKKTEGTFGTLGLDRAFETNKEYQVEISRNGSEYVTVLSDGDGQLIDSKKSSFCQTDGMEMGAPMYPGLSVIGAAATISHLRLEAGGNVLLNSEEWTGGFIPERKPWNEVDSPVLGTPELRSDGYRIAVPWTMEIGKDGADSLECTMFDQENQEVSKKTVSTEAGSGVFEFTPAASGSYRFSARASRASENDSLTSNVVLVSDYVLPLAAPAVRAVTRDAQTMSVIWKAVPEAESYELSYREINQESLTVSDAQIEYSEAEQEYQMLVSGLTAGSEYYFEVVAQRAPDERSLAGSCTAVLRQTMERDWQFAWFGTSTKKDHNTCSGNIYDGLILESTKGEGKFTGDGYDGMAFYYTKLDPQNENFELRATFTVEELNITNGQEGFALIARDSIGTHQVSASAFYSNSVAVMAAKTEYLNEEEDPVTLRLGIGSRVVKGLSETLTPPVPGSFSSVMTALDKRIQTPGEGNIIEEGEEYTFILKKTNTGYHMIYENEAGFQTEEIMYEPDALLRIDSDAVYVGFAAARNCKVSVSDITFTTSDPLTDPPAQERPITYVEPEYKMVSPKTTGSAQYTFIYAGNADGRVTITAEDGTLVMEQRQVQAAEKVSVGVDLVKGENRYLITMVPDPDYTPGPYMKLTSYDTITVNATVTYQPYGTARQTIVVAPDGKPDGTGSHENPLDIRSAIRFVQPGQTILMKAGTYELIEGLSIPYGLNGTAEQPIVLISDPDSDEPAVLNFMRRGTGFHIQGNYWYIRGIHVTRTTNMSKGIQLSGSYNTLDQVQTYFNGNTGLQISGSANDTKKDWPSYNLILNCTSYNNSDDGMIDADGFASKLTCGDGNVLRGCISFNNADDGYDLFAKVATGSIGSVRIEDCVSYHNGYLLDGTNAGNGNGFKLGGSALPGGHQLINCISFENKQKGIDSNSCPDIKVYRSTSYNNESYNVALYSNSGVKTNFSADGILSYKDNGSTIGEQLKLNGQEALESDSNYFYNGSYSSNKSNVVVSEDWFVSIDTSNLPIRRADGSIDMQGLFELTDAAPEHAGARLVPHGSAEILIPGAIEDPELPTEPPVEPPIEPGKTNRPRFDSTDDSGHDDVVNYPAGSGADGSWKLDEKGWCLQNPDGSLARSEWKQINGFWYFFDANGYMATGWRKLDKGQWYYLNQDGAMKTGWLLENQAWYYLRADGSMEQRAVTLNGVTYYFSQEGTCTNP